MKRKSFRLIITGLMCISALSCASLDTVTTVATQVGVATGTISADQAQSILKGATAVARSLEDFTPEQEYYIGRSVGAAILTKYQVLNDAKANGYINTLGQSLAVFSELPELFSGYSFLILNSDDVNAFATPGGHVFITKGLLRCAQTEDQLAAILAHEIGHIQMRHGMKAIETARLTEALTILATEGTKQLGGREIARLTALFGGAVSDITNTLVNKGYSRVSEFEADAAAIKILNRAGYSSAALIEMLETMPRHLRPGGLDFAKTHPLPPSRIMEIQKSGQAITSPISGARKERFLKAVGHLL